MDNKDIQRWEAGGVCGVAEAARILGYSKSSVLNMIDRGQLIAWRKGDRGKFFLYREQVRESTAGMRARGIRYAKDMQMTLDL